MPKMAIMIGLQASGKSTFCKSFLQAYERVNLDSLHTRKKEQQVLEAALEAGRNLVIDNTNPTAAERKRYIVPAKAKGYKIEGYFMQSRVGECIGRNSLREGKEKVPNAAIAATSNKLELPCLAEGFDALYFVSITENGIKVEDWEEEE